MIITSFASFEMSLNRNQFLDISIQKASEHRNAMALQNTRRTPLTRTIIVKPAAAQNLHA
jgi:hypothetical protein